MKKHSTNIFLFLLLGVSVIFGTCKFEYDSRVSDFVPVESIIGVPTGGVKGYEITLNRTVSPPTATNQAIVWSIEEDGGTNATLNRNKLTATETGIVTVKAFIKDGKARGLDYTQEFEIKIFPEYIVVSVIQDIPSKILAGTLKLDGKVKPDNAVNNTIIWELKDAGVTGAALDGDILTTSAYGKLTVTAIVENGAGHDSDYRQDFEIRVAPLSVSSITGVATGCVVGDYTLFAIVSPRNATFKDITWKVKAALGLTMAEIDGDLLTTYNPGPVKITAVVKDGIDFGYDYIQEFSIEIKSSWDYRSVDEINDLPTGCSVGDYLLLGRIDPRNPTNTTIIWELKDAGETGAVIDGNVLTTLRPGTITITAIVKDGTAPGEDYTQNFDMVITE